ncbi:hypothetical protein GCM10007928_12020 [Sulfitobacter porphyrae]|nr:hypothetical protein GCM10007928_12020 [Sulfitobacter porphyrae]
MAYVAYPMVQTSSKTRANLKRILESLRSLFQRRKHPHLRDLTDRAARDAGIDLASLEPHRLRLPSQHSHHPRS